MSISTWVEWKMFLQCLYQHPVYQVTIVIILVYQETAKRGIPDTQLICLAITPYCRQHTVFINSFGGSYKAPFYAGNIKDFIRKSRTPTLKNELPFPYVSPPCFMHSPLPHLSLRWTGLTCGTWRHHSRTMEDKTCAKKILKILPMWEWIRQGLSSSGLKNHRFCSSMWWPKNA